MINNVSIAARKNIDKSDIANLDDNDEIWEVIGHYLGTLCANLTLVASPEVIVIGGGIIKRKAIYPFVLKSFSTIINGYLFHFLSLSLCK